MQLHVTNTAELTSIASAIRSAYYINDLLLYPNEFISNLIIPTIISETIFSTYAEQYINNTLSQIIADTSIKQVCNYGFYWKDNLQIVELLSCTSIGTDAFEGCIHLTNISCPICQYIGRLAFGMCPSLTTIFFPECLTIEEEAFLYNQELSSIAFPKCTAIGEDAFYDCSKLLSVYLLNSSVVTLSYGHPFSSTPIDGNTEYTSGVSGSVFVPASLLTAYQTAPYWSDIAARIVGI